MPKEGVIYDYVSWALKTTHAPPQFHLATILPCVAYELCRRGIGWSATESGFSKMHLWTGMIGGSSIGKSTVVESAQDFMRDLYNEVLGEGRYRDPWVQADGSPAGVRQHLIEKYFDFNIEQTLAILWHDEVARILRWEDGATAFCKFYDGRDYSFQLRHLQKENQSGVLKNPTLCAIFGGTPSSIERLTTSEHIEGGLFPRILWFRGAVPASQRMLVRHRYNEERRQLQQRWIDWTKTLNGQALLYGNSPIRITDEALDVVRDDLFEKYKEEFALEDRLEGARHRILSNHVYVIAAVYAASQGRLQVNADDMRRSVRLMLWCMVSVEQITATLAVMDEVRLRGRILEVVFNAGAKGVTLRNLFKALSSRVRDKKALNAAIELLVEMEEIVLVAVPKEGAQGKAHIVLVHAHFLTKRPDE